MNLTDPEREAKECPCCPNCWTDLTGETHDFGSPDEGEYIAYVCPTCAAYFGTLGDAMVYHPIWSDRP